MDERRAYIITNLSRFSVADFLDTVDTVIARMTDNDDYPNPPAPLTEISLLLTDMRVYTNKPAVQMSTHDRDQRDKIRKAINKMMASNAGYVILLFPGDKKKQESSGYPSIKERHSSNNPPGVPEDIKIRRSEVSGEVIINCKKRPGTRSLEIEYYSDEPGSPVRYFVTTSSKGIKISGLTPGRRYFFRIRAIGKRGVRPSDWSNPFDIIVG
jgi:hypothetical protein